MKRILAATAGGLLALLACAPTEAPETRLVVIDDNGTTSGTFEPASLEIAPGTEVRWRNVGARTYEVAAESRDDSGQPLIPTGAEPWRSGELRSGETFARVFEVEGTYVYWSPEHRDGQMIGTIVVEQP